MLDDHPMENGRSNHRHASEAEGLEWAVRVWQAGQGRRATAPRPVVLPVTRSGGDEIFTVPILPGGIS